MYKTPDFPTQVKNHFIHDLRKNARQLRLAPLCLRKRQ